jgi:hypothetical protein
MSGKVHFAAWEPGRPGLRVLAGTSYTAGLCGRYVTAPNDDRFTLQPAEVTCRLCQRRLGLPAQATRPGSVSSTMVEVAQVLADAAMELGGGSGVSYTMRLPNGGVVQVWPPGGLS